MRSYYADGPESRRSSVPSNIWISVISLGLSDLIDQERRYATDLKQSFRPYSFFRTNNKKIVDAVQRWPLRYLLFQNISDTRLRTESWTSCTSLPLQICVIFISLRFLVLFSGALLLSLVGHLGVITFWQVLCTVDVMQTERGDADSEVEGIFAHHQLPHRGVRSPAHLPALFLSAKASMGTERKTMDTHSILSFFFAKRTPC